MFIVHVFIQVKPEHLDPFKKATRENVENSIQEPGIARFDFLEQQDQPNHFMLIEVYNDLEDAARHKETMHYKRWRDTVAPMMAQPRTSVKYSNIAPSDSGWL